MANQQHHDLLKQGIDTWNSWRRENPEDKLDLSAIDLSGLDLRGFNLSEVDLHESTLSEANLAGANLVAPNLLTTTLSNQTLDGANLPAPRFPRTLLTRAASRRAHLHETSRRDAQQNCDDFWHARLDKIVPHNAHLAGTSLETAVAAGSPLSGVSPI